MYDFLLYGAGQLVTCSNPGKGPKRGKSLSDPGIVSDGAIAVSGGTIRAIGPRDDVLRAVGSARVERTMDAGGRVVMPGWVDPHTHAVFSRYRADEYEARIRGEGYLEIERRGGGIKRTVREVRAMSEDLLFEVSRRRLAKILEGGTTTIEIKSGYGLDLENELKMLRVIARLGRELPLDVVATFMGAHQKPPESSGGSGYVRLVIDGMIPAVAREGLAEFVDVFCEQGVFSVEETEEILLAARAAGLGLKVHADEITPQGGAELAARLGARSAEHLTKISRAGIDALASSDTIAVLLPATTFGLGSRDFAPAREMIDRGIAVALATDFNPGSSPSCSMSFVVAVACSQMRMTPAEAVNAATVNAAFAAGRGGRVGSLEKGMQADFAVHDVEDYREIPSRAGTNHAVAVVKAGAVAWERSAYETASEVGL
ncbi:MAG: imidazolonepropionase [Candidatus Latescibacterota bacterium]|jgi:imidazolonepropionase|nr:MAG: imidazolonepropionase [Candidatus Latescibacterota bacterium]